MTAPQTPPIASSGEAIPAGMKEWLGGPKPSDWSGEAVKFRNGKVMQAPVGAVWKLGWDHCYGAGDIIAYTPKTPPAASSGQDLREAAVDLVGMLTERLQLEGPGKLALITEVEKHFAKFAALLSAPAVQPGGDLVEIDFLAIVTDVMFAERKIDTGLARKIANTLKAAATPQPEAEEGK